MFVSKPPYPRVSWPHRQRGTASQGSQESDALQRFLREESWEARAEAARYPEMNSKSGTPFMAFQAAHISLRNVGSTTDRRDAPA